MALQDVDRTENGCLRLMKSEADVAAVGAGRDQIARAACATVEQDIHDLVGGFGIAGPRVTAWSANQGLTSVRATVRSFVTIRAQCRDQTGGVGRSRDGDRAGRVSREDGMGQSSRLDPETVGG